MAINWFGRSKKQRIQSHSKVWEDHAWFKIQITFLNNLSKLVKKLTKRERKNQRGKEKTPKEGRRWSRLMRSGLKTPRGKEKTPKENRHLSKPRWIIIICKSWVRWEERRRTGSTCKKELTEKREGMPSCDAQDSWKLCWEARSMCAVAVIVLCSRNLCL